MKKLSLCDLIFISVSCISFFFTRCNCLSGPGPPHYRRFTIILKHSTHSVGLLWKRCQLDNAEISTWQQTTLSPYPLVRFEPAFPVSERPRTHAFDRAATGIGLYLVYAGARKGNKLQSKNTVSFGYCVKSKLGQHVRINSVSSFRTVRNIILQTKKTQTLRMLVK
jgi:hypothetical protein